MSTPQPTPPGSVRFEAARRRLAKLLAVEVENVPDSEVQVYLERGAPPVSEAGRASDPEVD